MPKKKRSFKKKAVKKTTKKKAVKKNAKKKTLKKKAAKKTTKKKIVKKKAKKKKPKTFVNLNKEAKEKIVDELLVTVENPEDIYLQRLDREARELFHLHKKKTFYNWVKKYTPVLVPLMVGLITYAYLTFFVFYPGIISNGHYIKFLFLIMFIFLLAGIFIHLGIKHELLFIRILSFLFVFVILSFMVLFILVAHVVESGGL